jgi:hypothetical protein
MEAFTPQSSREPSALPMSQIFQIVSNFSVLNMSSAHYHTSCGKQYIQRQKSLSFIPLQLTLGKIYGTFWPQHLRSSPQERRVNQKIPAQLVSGQRKNYLGTMELAVVNVARTPKSKQSRSCQTFILSWF